MLNTNRVAEHIRYILISSMFSFIPIQAIAANSAMIELIEILNNKGSITNEEYQLLKNAAMSDQKHEEVTIQEIQKDVKDEVMLVTKDLNVTTTNWTSKISLKGDARMRYSGKKEEPNINRDRGRVRYRLGVIAQPT
ncbi:MAG: hypothetical protein ACI9XC_002755, partial [Gammaproteobacteria bacterium]